MLPHPNRQKLSKIGLIQFNYGIQGFFNIFTTTYLGVLMTQSGYSAASLTFWLLLIQLPTLFKPLVGVWMDKFPKIQIIIYRLVVGIGALMTSSLIFHDLLPISDGTMITIVVILICITITDTICDLYMIVNVKNNTLNFSAWTNLANFAGGQIALALFAFGIKDLFGNWAIFFSVGFVLWLAYEFLVSFYHPESLKETSLAPITSPAEAAPIPLNSVKYDLKNVMWVILFCGLFAINTLGDIPFEIFAVTKFGSTSLTIIATTKFIWGIFAMGIYFSALIPKISTKIRKYRMQILIGCGVIAVLNWALLDYMPFFGILGFLAFGEFVGVLINLIFISILIDTTYAKKPATSYQIYAFVYVFTSIILRSMGPSLVELWGYATLFWIIALAYLLLLPVIAKIKLDPIEAA